MADYALQLVVGPTSEPITLAQAKLHCRVDVDVDADDELIGDLITTAREYCEEVLGQALAIQTWRLYLDRFPGWEIEVPRSPLVSVTSITYVDLYGTSRVLDAEVYLVDAVSKYGRITPTWNNVWPPTRYQANAVEVLFVAGSATVPMRVKQAMKLLIGHWYVNREAVVTGTIQTEIQMAVEALLMSAWTGTY